MAPTRARAVAALALLVLALTSCSDGDQKSAGDLPQGDELIRRAASEMRGVQSTHFDLATEGTVERVPVRTADGTLTRDGKAQGNLRIDQGGSTLELAFVIVGQSAYIKGPTGGYQKLPRATATAVYDPSAILDPDRGVAKVLATAKDGKTEAKESVGGKDTYRVKATLDQQALGALVPGVDKSVTGELWIRADRPLLAKARIPVPKPGSTGDGDGGTVTVTLSDIDAPVQITPPAG